MFRSLYARMMVLVMAVLMLAMGLLSMLLYISIREDRIDARLNELATQATEVAYLASQRSIVNLTTDRYLIWKIQNIQAGFDAGILVLDRLGRSIHTGIEDGALQGLSLEQASAYLKTVQQTGEPIRVRTPAEGREGDTTFTVVVPWKQFDVVMGAVIIHTNAQTIQASYKNILRQMAYAMATAIALAGVLFLLATRSISRPVGQMANAAERIARGEFDEQIQVRHKDEIGRLAVAFNRMSSDLKNVEEMRRSFVSDVSHELRSPLTSMQGFLQGMLDGTIPCEDRDQYIRIVMEETRRMNKLVTSLLELSRIESGKVPLHLTRFDINEVIRRVLIRQEARIDEKRLEVDVEFRQEPCMVRADMDRIEQVVTNLVDNAVKYVQEGGRLTLWTHTVNNLAHVTIADNGPGIPEEELPFVFERFYTVDKARTSGKGTGLGLSIVKKIMELHGQSVRVASQAGKGASFIFTLPYEP